MDTNVLISALFHNDKHAQKLLSCIAENRILLVLTEEIADEYLHVVMLHALRAGLTLKQAKRPLQKLARILVKGKLVVPGIRLSIVLSDPDDDKFFECAYEADTTVIVSQDGDVSEVEQASTCTGRQIAVYSPWQFFQAFKDI